LILSNKQARPQVSRKNPQVMAMKTRSMVQLLSNAHECFSWLNWYRFSDLAEIKLYPGGIKK
jgi:hypothetical protein